MKQSYFVEKTKDLVRDFVFGMQDGLISNLGLALGVWQGGGDRFTILLAGAASMLAGAFSMSAGSYLSAKSQREVYEQEIAHAKRILKEHPKEYLREMRVILKQEGFDADEIKVLLRHFEKHNHSTFVTNYIQKRLCLSEAKLEFPIKNAAAMFFSFIFGSLFPILPFVFFENSLAAALAVLFTIIALFFIGWAKSLFTKLDWVKSGWEIVIIGVGAGIIGYAVGHILNLVGQAL